METIAACEPPLRIVMPLVDDRFGANELAPRFGSAPSALFEGIQMLPEGEVEIHVISCVERPAPAPSRIGRNLFYHQAVLPHWAYLRSLHAGPVLSVGRILRKLKPDIVHAQGSERWAGWSSLPFRGPKILTLHGFLRRINRICPMEPRLYWKMQEWMEAVCLRCFDGVIAISEATRKDLAASTKRSWLLPNAVESAMFDVPRNPAEAGVFLNVGLICANKNQHGVLRAFKRIGKLGQSGLRFLGEQSLGWDGLPAFLAEAVQPWCTLVGRVGRAELRGELSRARALVHFSFEENCPMAVLEAMAAGVPVIATKIGAIPDWMRHGENGLVVEPGDEEGLNRAMRFILENPDRAEEIGAAGRSTALELFHPRRIADAHIAIYRDLSKKFGD